MASIQPITDDLIVVAIRQASKRVVMIAPGVWPPVANAIAEAWPRLGSDRVTAILEIDHANALRSLGYAVWQK